MSGMSTTPAPNAISSEIGRRSHPTVGAGDRRSAAVGEGSTGAEPHADRDVSMSQLHLWTRGDSPDLVVLDYQYSSDDTGADHEINASIPPKSRPPRLFFVQVGNIVIMHTFYLSFLHVFPRWKNALDCYLRAIRTLSDDDDSNISNIISVRVAFLKFQKTLESTRKASQRDCLSIAAIVLVSMNLNPQWDLSNGMVDDWSLLPGSMAICCCIVSIGHSRAQAEKLGDGAEAAEAWRCLYRRMKREEAFDCQHLSSKMIFMAPAAWHQWACVSCVVHIMIFLWRCMASGYSIVYVAAEVIRKYWYCRSLLDEIATGSIPGYEPRPSHPCNLIIFILVILGTLHYAYVVNGLGKRLYSSPPTADIHAAGGPNRDVLPRYIPKPMTRTP